MDVLMPQFGETITEGTIIAWLKKEGDAVRRGENLFEVETDKATMEVQATSAGFLSDIKVGVGETALIGTVVAKITERTMPASRDIAGFNFSADEKSLSESPFEAVRTPQRCFGSRKPILGLNTSPLAQRLAAQSGIDLGQVAERVKASGARRIKAADVRAFTEDKAPEAGNASPPLHGKARVPDRSAAETGNGAHIAPLSRLRAATARRMTEAWRTAPHVYQAVEVDFTRIVKAREQAKAAFRQRFAVTLTYLPFVARAVTMALADFPKLNATFSDQELKLESSVHLGIAVDLDHSGLVVPVVKHAENLTVSGLACAIAELANSARRGSLRHADISGGSYSISNNGSFGATLTTPIINVPQVATLSFDAVTARALVVNTPEGDVVLPRPAAWIGQSFDHRAVDGAYSAAFLRRLSQLLSKHDWSAEVGAS